MLMVAATLMVATGALRTAPIEVAGAPAQGEPRRIKLYDKTPNLVEGRETESDPTEPTLDLYIPEAGKSTGVGVLLMPGGGYQSLTVPSEGPEPARFFLSHNISAFVLRYRHGPRY